MLEAGRRRLCEAWRTRLCRVLEAGRESRSHRTPPFGTRRRLGVGPARGRALLIAAADRQDREEGAGKVGAQRERVVRHHGWRPLLARAAEEGVVEQRRVREAPARVLGEQTFEERAKGERGVFRPRDVFRNNHRD